MKPGDKYYSVDYYGKIEEIEIFEFKDRIVRYFYKNVNRDSWDWISSFEQKFAASPQLAFNLTIELLQNSIKRQLDTIKKLTKLQEENLRGI